MLKSVADTVYACYQCVVPTVQARREAHLVSQASQPRGMARKVAVSRVHQQPDVEDACLVAKKTSPQAAVSGTSIKGISHCRSVEAVR